jgi:hypothetical protein
MATITTIKAAKWWHWRTIAYSVLAALFGLQFAIGLSASRRALPKITPLNNQKLCISQLVLKSDLCQLNT